MDDDATVDALARATSDAWLALENLRSSWRRAIGVSAYEMQAISNLRGRSMTIGALGEQLALSSGAMTGLVDRLVAAKLLERIPDERDRRRVLLRTTASADEAIARLERAWGERLAAAFAEAGIDEQDAVVFAVDRIRESALAEAVEVRT